jgi:hypothetical protein
MKLDALFIISLKMMILWEMSSGETICHAEAQPKHLGIEILRFPRLRRVKLRMTDIHLNKSYRI